MKLFITFAHLCAALCVEWLLDHDGTQVVVRNVSDGGVDGTSEWPRAIISLNVNHCCLVLFPSDVVACACRGKYEIRLRTRVET